MFLSRGYGGKERGPIRVEPGRSRRGRSRTSDEPLLLAAAAPVVVARNRQKAGAADGRCGSQADIIVMDDGHQNFALAKDLSFVVVDAANGFGNGRIVPAGPLRESVAQGLARVDAVILVGSGNPPLDGFSGPVLRAHLKPAPEEAIGGKRVVAFAGIGRPEKFFATLADLGADIVEENGFADHHSYTAAELARLKARARNAGAILMTEKDFVRLSAARIATASRFCPLRRSSRSKPLWTACLTGLRRLR